MCALVADDLAPPLCPALADAGWELAFWAASVPVCLVAYYGVTGHLPDLTDQDDVAKLGTEAFAFVNLARFAVPLRIGLALGTVPWVQANIIDRVAAWRKRREAGRSERTVSMVRVSERECPTV